MLRVRVATPRTFQRFSLADCLYFLLTANYLLLRVLPRLRNLPRVMANLACLPILPLALAFDLSHVLLMPSLSAPALLAALLKAPGLLIAFLIHLLAITLPPSPCHYTRIASQYPVNSSPSSRLPPPYTSHLRFKDITPCRCYYSWSLRSSWHLSSPYSHISCTSKGFLQ